MISVEELKQNPIPEHVAIIMDGNGRWAKERGLERIEGHQKGATALRNVLQAALATGVKYLTVYAFSIENWQRPDNEVSALMTLFVNACSNELENLTKHHIRFHVIGNLDLLPQNCRQSLQETEIATQNNTALQLTVALSYGSRWEIVHAAKMLAKDIKNNLIDIESIDNQVFTKYLQTYPLPDPDLLIRTSKEVRISNFLLWQIAYTELYFTDIYWPDFTEQDFYAAIAEFQKRERRFGKIKELKIEN